MKLARLNKALGIFATLDPTHFYAHHAHMFVLIAEMQPCTQQELAKALGVSPSSISRTLMALGETTRKGEAGYDLLDVGKDPDEGRRFLIRLNARGEALRRALEAC